MGTDAFFVERKIGAGFFVNRKKVSVPVFSGKRGFRPSLHFCWLLFTLLGLSCGNSKTESKQVAEYVEAVGTAIAEGGPLPTPRETISPEERRPRLLEEDEDDFGMTLGEFIREFGDDVPPRAATREVDRPTPVPLDELTERVGMTEEEFRDFLERNGRTYGGLLLESYYQEIPPEDLVHALLELEESPMGKPWRDETCGFWIPPPRGGPQLPAGYVVVSVTGERLGPLANLPPGEPGGIPLPYVSSLALLCKGSAPAESGIDTLVETLAELVVSEGWTCHRFRYMVENRPPERCRQYRDQNTLLYDLALLRTSKALGKPIGTVDIYLKRGSNFESFHFQSSFVPRHADCPPESR